MQEKLLFDNSRIGESRRHLTFAYWIIASPFDIYIDLTDVPLKTDSHPPSSFKPTCKDLPLHVIKKTAGYSPTVLSDSHLSSVKEIKYPYPDRRPGLPVMVKPRRVKISL